MKKIVSFITFASLLAAATLLAACGWGSTPNTPVPAPVMADPIQGKIIVSGPAENDLTVTLSNSTGRLRHHEIQEFQLAFTDASGKAVDVGTASLNFQMPKTNLMPEMNSQATLTATETAGVYRCTADLEMGHQWQARINYDGPAGEGSASFPIEAGH